VILADVNVLVYAFRADADRHQDYRRWLLAVLDGTSVFGVSQQVLSAVVRVTTHPRVFRTPSTVSQALAYTEALRTHPLCRLVRPGERHWTIFCTLCMQANAKGNLVADAWYAALAIESGCTWVTSDRDYARFPGLNWTDPLGESGPVRNR
jgi:toxin-antitoxin system PIN domain toxin